MSPKVKPGDRVIIAIRTSEVFEGTVETISARSIELYDIYCQTTDVKYEGNMTFYRNEVESITHITDKTTGEATSSGKVTTIPFETYKKIKMHPDEFDRLKNMYLQFNFIDMNGTKLKEAVEVLSNRESVAVAGLGSSFTRGKPLSLLLMADFKQVYIFDIYCLVNLMPLKYILESDFIVKVVHDGAALFDCLYHKYGVEMRNVFDTQVVDTMLEKKENNGDVKRNLSECLAHHFNFPPALLSTAMENMHDKFWQDRPVIKKDKATAAQLVAYLLTLRDHFMKKILQEYSKTTTDIFNKYKNLSDIQLLNKTMTLHGFKR